MFTISRAAFTEILFFHIFVLAITAIITWSYQPLVIAIFLFGLIVLFSESTSDYAHGEY